ncbi:hypothetical protein HNP60_002564 [Sphingobium sp. B1D3A]|uniref:Uncharacterized protein n=1 Tax=Sphingobium lignivorans TaxID=2735886 RepID=A0ABR6NH33_9SPHN|nr:hypothetical protein [Sphingobium lignivorans]
MRTRTLGGLLLSPSMPRSRSDVRRHSSLWRRQKIDALLGKYWQSDPGAAVNGFAPSVVKT